jgi:DNA-binding MarR family transcriptional regulator
LAFEANPHHRRAQLVVLTDKGRKAYEAAMSLQVPWINGLADGLTIKDMEMFRRVVVALRQKLEASDGDSN